MIIDAADAPAVFESIGWSAINVSPDDLMSLVPIIQNDKRYMFLRETATDGTKWAPLSPRTIAQKGFSTILIDTGRLWDSLTTPWGNSDTLLEVSGNPPSLVFGTKVPYAKLHETGTRHMPARPITGLTEQAVNEIAEAVADSVVRRLGRE
jgi:phage gpG-like protein